MGVALAALQASHPSIEDPGQHVEDEARMLIERGQLEKACAHLQNLLDDSPYSNKCKWAAKMMDGAGCEAE